MFASLFGHKHTIVGTKYGLVFASRTTDLADTKATIKCEGRIYAVSSDGTVIGTFSNGKARFYTNDQPATGPRLGTFYTDHVECMAISTCKRDRAVALLVCRGIEAGETTVTIVPLKGSQDMHAAPGLGDVAYSHDVTFNAAREKVVLSENLAESPTRHGPGSPQIAPSAANPASVPPMAAPDDETDDGDGAATADGASYHAQTFTHRFVFAVLHHSGTSEARAGSHEHLSLVAVGRAQYGERTSDHEFLKGSPTVTGVNSIAMHPPGSIFIASVRRVSLPCPRLETAHRQRRSPGATAGTTSQRVPTPAASGCGT
jgi:hypothetical protein